MMRVLLLWLACIGPLSAAEILHVNIEQRDRRYIAEVDVRFAAPIERVQALVTDYSNLARINDAILESEVLEHNGPAAHCVRTRAKVCVAFFCREIEQVQDVSVMPTGDIVATVRPAVSDFSYGYAHWRFWQEPTGTRMRFTTEIEPGFWVPPLVGPWLVKQALYNETLKSVTNLDRLAMEAPTPPVTAAH